MMRLRFFLSRRQRGFSLVETAMAIAISGAIGLAASMTIAQVSTETSRNSDYTVLSQQAMNAVHWLGQDVQMAQTIDGANSFPATPLELSWEWWDNSTYTVNYTLENGALTRVFSNGTSQTQTLVADYISSDSDWTNCVSSNGTLTFTITASMGEGSHSVNVTRVREVTARPQL